MMEYWARILAALALIKMASTLVRDAEKLITASVKAKNPELADELDGSYLARKFGGVDIDELGEQDGEPSDDPADPGVIAQQQEWADPLDNEEQVSHD